MNGIATFRLCKLSNDELIKKVDSGTDEMYQTGKIPTRSIPARPDQDYDLLVGEMIYRLDEQSARIRELEETVAFFASVIKSGEPWTEQCEQALNKKERE